MRGESDDQLPLFHVFEVEDRIRSDHPLRDLKRRTDRILAAMSVQFDAASSRTGRPSIPPERLLKALLLQCLYTIRSERQLCEQIDVNLLFRWFLDLQPGDDAFDATSFGKNCPRLDEHGLAQAFFDAVVALTHNLCSEHFSVDGTLIESLASAKSFRPKDAADTPGDGNGFKPRNPEVDFHGQNRTNDTHASTTDPEAKLYRKGRGKEAKLSHMGHGLTENRHGLIVTARAAGQGSGRSEDGAAEPADADAGHPGPAADETPQADASVQTQPEVPQEGGGGLRLVENGGWAGAVSDGGPVEAAAGIADWSRGVQPGAIAEAGPGLTRKREPKTGRSVKNQQSNANALATTEENRCQQQFFRRLLKCF